MNPRSRTALAGKPEGPVARREDYLVEPCPHATARALVAKHHYAKGTANTSVASHCLVRRATGEVVGAALWMPPTAGAAKGLAKQRLGDAARFREVLVLSRLVVAPGEPQNAAGMLLSGSERLVRGDCRWSLLATYADEAEGHAGTIYKATNWLDDGLTQARARWQDPKTGKRVAVKSKVNRTHATMRELGYEQLPSSRKRRFLKVLPECAPEDPTRRRPRRR